MKYFLISLAVSLLFLGCSEDLPEGPYFPTSKPFSSLKETDFVKAVTQVPASIPQKLDTVTSCQVDSVGGRSAKESVTIQDKTKVGFVGWAANGVKGTLPKDVFVALYGPAKFYFKTFTGLARADVSQALKKSEIKNCGWEAYANLSDMPSGTYYMQVIQVEGSTGSSCDTQRTIVLK